VQQTFCGENVALSLNERPLGNGPYRAPDIRGHQQPSQPLVSGNLITADHPITFGLLAATSCPQSAGRQRLTTRRGTGGRRRFQRSSFLRAVREARLTLPVRVRARERGDLVRCDVDRQQIAQPASTPDRRTGSQPRLLRIPHGEPSRPPVRSWFDAFHRCHRSTDSVRPIATSDFGGMRVVSTPTTRFCPSSRAMRSCWCTSSRRMAMLVRSRRAIRSQGLTLSVLPRTWIACAGRQAGSTGSGGTDAEVDAGDRR
jgi:hypothetical protein